MTLKLGMQQLVLKLYQIFPNDDPDSPWHILQQGQIWDVGNENLFKRSRSHVHDHISCVYGKKKLKKNSVRFVS